MNHHIISYIGDIISSTMPSSCIDCVKANAEKGYGSIECPLDRIKKRLGVVKNTQGTLYACSGKHKTTKLFKDEILSISITLKSLQKFQESIKKEYSKKIRKEEHARVDRFVHNIKSINAHCIQTLFTCIPQSVMMHDYHEALEAAKDRIRKDPNEVARTMIRIAKNNMSLKAEISVYEKLIKDVPQLQPRNINLRDVVMIVLYMFFTDFNERNVYVDVQNYYEKAYFDFESVQVAIYHIVENAAKYVKPDSTIYVKFGQVKDKHYVIFEMDSLYVYPEEREKVDEEGYSGKIAKSIGKAGKGIGMSRVAKLLALNSISFEKDFGNVYENVGQIKYASNMFSLRNIPSEKR